MKPIQKTLKLSKSNYYKVHLNIINALLPVKLTPMELDVLSAYLSIPPIFRFTKTGNKIVREATNLTYSGLSNYIAILIKKGFLKQDIAGNITTLPILEVADDGQTYLIKLTNYENEV